MLTKDVREKFFDFFGKRGHQLVKPSPLVLENDPTTLFTSSGMQQLIPYLLGKKHSLGKRLFNSQPCFRSVDIEDVGDNRHTTFFEMLGNWSLGDYFKKEQIAWVWEFLTKELGFEKERLYVTVFKGAEGVPRDEESYNIWRSLGLPKERIFFYGQDKNWWSRAGEPKNMPSGEVGGPDTEVFYEFKEVVHNERFSKQCHPNCDCGRFLEIANSVFIEYVKDEKGKLVLLKQKNVDFGGGLERITASLNENPDIFLTDVFLPIIRELERKLHISYFERPNEFRVIADHLKSSVFILHAGVLPGNKEHGYVLRRLIRRASLSLRRLIGSIDETVFSSLVKPVYQIYKDLYLEEFNQGEVENYLIQEVKKFKKALELGLKEIEKMKKINGKRAFFIYQTYGLPWEILSEIFLQRGIKVDEGEFLKEYLKHKERSKKSSFKRFVGGLVNRKANTIRLHTATHLLHQALREVLGKSVKQMGSNINEERLRFDISFSRRLEDRELKRVERLINKKIEESLPVFWETKSLKEAKKEGALAFFAEKYPDKVKVYTIGESKTKWFSKEVCFGPHVKNTSEIGNVRIIKQEKIGENLLRIYATNCK